MILTLQKIACTPSNYGKGMITVRNRYNKVTTVGTRYPMDH